MFMGWSWANIFLDAGEQLLMPGGDHSRRESSSTDWEGLATLSYLRVGFDP